MSTIKASRPRDRSSEATPQCVMGRGADRWSQKPRATASGSMPDRHTHAPSRAAEVHDWAIRASKRDMVGFYNNTSLAWRASEIEDRGDMGSGSEGRVGVEPYTGSRSSAGNTANGESLVSESKVEGGEGAMSHQKKRERGGTTCKPRTNLSNQPGISYLCSFTLRVGLCETATPGISNSEYEPQPTNLHDPK